MDWLCIKELLLILWSVVMLLQLCYKAEFLSVKKKKKERVECVSREHVY